MKNFIIKYITNSITIVGMLSLIICLIIYSNNDYMQFKDRYCKVVDKLQSEGSYKHSGHFYLVLQDNETNIIFDRIVSPATYSQAKLNTVYKFNLRNFDIQQNTRDNVIYFFGQVIFAVLAFVLLIGGFIDVIVKNN